MQKRLSFNAKTETLLHAGRNRVVLERLEMNCHTKGHYEVIELHVGLRLIVCLT